jgi:hypothetical protein
MFPLLKHQTCSACLHVIDKGVLSIGGNRIGGVMVDQQVELDCYSASSLKKTVRG